MNDTELQEALWEIGEPVDIEVFVTEGTVEIKNFKVPESKQGSGEKVGPRVMNNIIELAENNGIKKIVAHIDWTHRDENGYPNDKNPMNDPTVKFLEQQGFHIPEYFTDRTLLGRLHLQED